MRKLVLITLSMIVVTSMLLSGCAAPAPQTVVQTVVVPQTVVQTQEVVKTVVVQATAAPAAPVAEGYPRNETLYMGGTQWGPPTGFNPWNLGNYATGTLGLCYETMFIYDPLTDKYTPWLAESGTWTSDSTYEVKVRQGVTWSTGDALTADDIKYTFDEAKTAPVSISPVWAFLASVDKVDDATVKFTFSQPAYQRWANYLYNTPIVSKKAWEGKDVKKVTSGLNSKPECTGPYVPETLDQQKVVWIKRDGWWATKALSMDPQPKRIVDIVNSGSNNVALGMVLQGGYDLNNNFLPGISNLVQGGYGVQTYYPAAPYHLSANTAWLLLNLTKKPMDDVAFRKAVAFAVDTDQIVNVVYAGMVMKSDPTGLLPTWDKYIDKDVTKKLGFSYDAAKAKQILAGAGYKDIDGDKFVEAPDGSKISLKINNPNGWTDWMEANNVIVKSLQAVGINAQTNFPDYGGYVDQRNQGTFDMMIANDAQISNTPWSYYNWMLQNPIKDIATIQNGNYGRYDNQAAFDLMNQLDKVKIDDLAGMKAITSQLQTKILTDMPLIPLWYNGMWSQTNDSVWTNWPAAADGSNHYMASSWRGYWNMTAIQMLCNLKPAPAE